jgi:capsular polysaccharide biosynthesis protein
VPWTRPDFPLRPTGEHAAPPVTVTVDDAFLTRVEHGPLAATHGPRRWLRGAVHDAGGDLVKPSQKLCTGANTWAPADPRSVRVPDGEETLEGRWLYGGHWMQHFGHFLTETLTTLWPTPEEAGQLVGLVFHKYLKRPWAEEAWQRSLLDRAGYAGLPVRVVDGRTPLRVEQLVVPGRAVVAHGWAHPQAREVWDRVAAPFRGAGTGPGDAPRRVFLSRTGHNEARRAAGHRSADRSTAEWDAAVDRAFAAAGFSVVRPEGLDVDAQLRLVAGAELVAGASGSALHLSAFAPPTARVLEIGDARSPAQPVAMQLIVDTVCGHEHAFLRGDLPLDDLLSRIEEMTT